MAQSMESSTDSSEINSLELTESFQKEFEQELQQYADETPRQLHLDETQASYDGINMFLNNRYDEAEEFFASNSQGSVMMSAGSCLLAFFRGLMNYDADLIERAREMIKKTQALCNRILKMNYLETNPFAYHQAQVVNADCMLYTGLLYFAQQEFKAYIKGGWYVRKAWKSYERTFIDLKKTTNTKKKNTAELTDEEKYVLENSVGFGYGLFNLFVSLIPSNLLVFVSLLGFVGDRSEGLESLNRGRRVTELHGPMSLFVLLWYYTISKPLLSVNDNEVSLSVEVASELLAEYDSIYGESAVFNYFKGRLARLKHDLNGALEQFQLALDRCRGQKEIEMIGHYEIGWCQMACLNYKAAHQAFKVIQYDSRWSKGFYMFLSAITLGANGSTVEAMNLIQEVATIKKRRTNQVEAFVDNKSKMCVSAGSEFSPTLFQLLCLETLYLWKFLPLCNEKTLKTYLKFLHQFEDFPETCFLAFLLQGAILTVLKDYDTAFSYLYKVFSNRTIDMPVYYKYVYPYTCYELGVICLNDRDDTKSADEYFGECVNKYKNYDFDQRLQIKIHNIQQSML